MSSRMFPTTNDREEMNYLGGYHDLIFYYAFPLKKKKFRNMGTLCESQKLLQSTTE